MPRGAGTKNLRTVEFIAKFEALSKKYDDPVEVLFRMLKSRKQSIKLQAAKELLPYRYPKLAAAHITSEQPTQMSLGWENEGFVIDVEPSADEIAAIQQLSDEGVTIDAERNDDA